MTFGAAEGALGPLDCICANAGVSTMRRIPELTEQDWDFNMDVNAKGVFLTNRKTLRRWLPRGTKGTIVNTASLAAKIGAPLLAHYSASKFVVIGWPQGLAREAAASGVSANCVCPGFVKTGMQDREAAWKAELRGMAPDAVIADDAAQTPLGRLEVPEDVSRVVVFLRSDLAWFMTGQALNITGGAHTT